VGGFRMTKRRTNANTKTSDVFIDKIYSFAGTACARAATGEETMSWRGWDVHGRRRAGDSSRLLKGGGAQRCSWRHECEKSAAMRARSVRLARLWVGPRCSLTKVFVVEVLDLNV